MSNVVYETVNEAHKSVNAPSLATATAGAFI